MPVQAVVSCLCCARLCLQLVDRPALPSAAHCAVCRVVNDI